MTAPTGPDRTGVVARLDALEAAHKAATRAEEFWERCGCLAGLGEIPSVSDCHQAGLCRMRQREQEHDRAHGALLAAVRGVLDMHVPWYEINGVRHEHTVNVPCTEFPDCDGDHDADCPGSDGDGHEVPACAECRWSDGDVDGYLLWPCPTVRTVAAALGEA